MENQPQGSSSTPIDGVDANREETLNIGFSIFGFKLPRLNISGPRLNITGEKDLVKEQETADGIKKEVERPLVVVKKVHKFSRDLQIGGLPIFGLEGEKKSYESRRREA